MIEPPQIFFFLLLFFKFPTWYQSFMGLRACKVGIKKKKEKEGSNTSEFVKSNDIK